MGFLDALQAFLRSPQPPQDHLPRPTDAWIRQQTVSLFERRLAEAPEESRESIVKQYRHWSQGLDIGLVRGALQALEREYLDEADQETVERMLVVLMARRNVVFVVTDTLLMGVRMSAVCVAFCVLELCWKSCSLSKMTSLWLLKFQAFHQANSSVA